MSINKYINWSELWQEEFCLQTSIDNLDEDNDTDKEIIGVINQFIADKQVELDKENCFLRNDGSIAFFFSEQGGQNESETQGWNREYCFIVE
jgi:hypothetical protein